MQGFVAALIPFCWLAAVVGWIWLITLGYKHRGIPTALLFIIVSFTAIVYGFRQWRDPESSVNTRVPFFMMSGGLTMVLLLTILSSTY
ncbi:MAG: hypothetical protein PVH24_02015 [Candidatus Zixiibacteriota bacterium]|jgi:hypothetical protein